MLIGVSVEGILKLVLSESLTTPRVNVTALQAAVSMFITVTV